MAINVNTKLYDKIVDRNAMIRLFERRIQGKVSIELDGHRIRTDKLIREASLSKKGFNTLLRALDEVRLETFKGIHNITERSLLDLVTDQASFAYQNLEAAAGKIWRVYRPNRRIAEEIVLERPLFADKTLSQGWAGVSVGERKRMERVIRNGIAQGLSAEEIAKNVRQGSVHKITRNQARALVVTGVTSVTAQTDLAVMQANEKSLRGWQYVAVLDSRTSDLCAHRDGTIYPMDDVAHLPPAHYYCRSSITPVFKSYDDIAKLEGVAQIRKRNLDKLTPRQIQFYDGQTPLKESYNQWLIRQPTSVQLRHLGDYKKVELYNQGQLHISKFTNDKGNSLGIRELRAITDGEYVTGDTRRFAIAKEKLDAMHLGAVSPDDFIDNPELTKTLQDYYLLQAGELDGTLSLTNYRGILIGSKRRSKRAVLSMPPREDQVVFNPFTHQYDDIRRYQPSIHTLATNLRLVDESEDLLDRDKAYIKSIIDSLSQKMGVNERAAVADNLRIVFTRYRKKPEPWTNFKAVSQAQIKFDVMNVSDMIETQLRKDKNVLLRLKQDGYIDPILGETSLQDIHDSFIDNIRARNKWEDVTAPKLARQLRQTFDYKFPTVINNRLSEDDKKQFYLRFAKRLGQGDMPDRDQFAVDLGRDLYNQANLNGSRNQWYELGMKLLDAKNAKKHFEIATYGVQQRRMRSRLSGKAFGPKYDILSYNIKLTDPKLLEYSQFQRGIDVGLRTGVLNDKNKLYFRENSKTYWMKTLFGYEDTRIGITSSTSFGDFPESLVDKDLVDALSWTGDAKYKVDPDFYDFMQKLLYFEDDRGKAKYFHDLNEYRHYMASRGDFYERFKAMGWHRGNDSSFSNIPFVDHRGRIYDRGLIGPQSGESFRPYLNTAEALNFSPEGFVNLQDQIGAFLGGIDDYFEGRYNGLSFTGKQKIAEKWRKELITLGNHMRRGKPNDIRAILENKTLARVDGEEQGKLLRFAIEMSKINEHLGGDYTQNALEKLKDYKIALALEQDASSSGAQIIALTTRNKQLAELSNVIPTTQKKRLYDEIAAATFSDPRFKLLNQKLGLTEKDLRKASKFQNMVTLYGAGERTGILQVEKNLAKALGKEEGTLMVTATDRDTVLGEISARMAKYQRFDMNTYNELKALRENVKDIFNKGLSPSDELIEDLYFLDSASRDFVDKLSESYMKIVTPDDFKAIAKIMSEHLSEQVPILKDFTKYFGRLAQDYLLNADPKKSNFDWKSIAKKVVYGKPDKPFTLPDRVSELLGVKAKEPITLKLLKRLSFWKTNSSLHEMLYGVESASGRRIGAKYFKYDILSLEKPSFVGTRNLGPFTVKVATIPSKLPFGTKEVFSIEFFEAEKLPKSWTTVPWVNFDGKVVEQHFTQKWEQRLAYKDADGNWVNNLLQVPQKTEATWWEQAINKEGKINDIANVTKARTAYAVNGNHSNDATLVKQFHLWGKKNKIPTSTIHDAFFGNAQIMMKARRDLKKIYANSLNRNSVKDTLDEMRARGLPYSIYKKYLNEAEELGIIPVAGKSRVGGRLLTEEDILHKEDILEEVLDDFTQDYGWYGVG